MCDRLNILYERKPCYDIVFTKNFDKLLEELNAFEIETRKICIISDSKVASLYGEEIMNILNGNCKKKCFIFISGG